MSKFHTIKSREPAKWEVCFVLDGRSETGKWLEWDSDNREWYDDDIDTYVNPTDTIYITRDTIQGRFLDFFQNLS